MQVEKIIAIQGQETARNLLTNIEPEIDKPNNGAGEKNKRSLMKDNNKVIPRQDLTQNVSVFYSADSSSNMICTRRCKFAVLLLAVCMLIFVIVVASLTYQSHYTFTKTEVVLDPRIVKIQQKINSEASKLIVMLNEKPDLLKYQDDQSHSQSNRNLDDDWNNSLYGGSVLDPINIEYYDRKIYNSL